MARSRPAPRPVPGDAGWYPADLTWYRVARGHLLIRVRHRFLWRSSRPLAVRSDVGAIVRGNDRSPVSEVSRRERLGGLIYECYQAAA